jgi:hypothetical protein
MIKASTHLTGKSQPSNITINVYSVKDNQNKMPTQPVYTTTYNPSTQTSNNIHRQFTGNHSQGNIFNPYKNIIPQNAQQDKLKDFLSQLATSKKAENIKDSSKSDITDTLSAQEDTFEKEYSLEEENLKHIWSGFITRTGKLRVGIDMFQLRYECADYFVDYNLNISHRINYDEILKRPILGIVAISPQNETQVETFDEYIGYFNDKLKAGVVTMKNNISMYILPRNDFSQKFYLNNSKKHMLGILANSGSELLNFSITLPPPVISIHEKKKRAANIKKNTNVIEKDRESITNRSNNLLSYEIPDDSEVKELLKNLHGDGLMEQLTQISKNADNIDKLQEIANNPKLVELLQNPVIQSWLSKQ